MTILTLITVLVMIYGAVNRRGYGRALALGGATAAGAAIVVGDTAIPTFYAVALGTIVILIERTVRASRSDDELSESRSPGLTPLLLLVAWGTLVTIAAPALFHGTEVLAPAGSLQRLGAGVVTSSNLAQVIYLVLGACIVLYLARSRHTSPDLIGLAAGLTTLLSFWRYLSQTVGLPFPEGVFDNSPSFAYIEMAPGGLERFRGILSEPSGLAITSLVTISYMIARSIHVRGWHRIGVLAVAAIAAYLAAISTSGTFVVAGVAVAVIAGVAFLGRFVLKGASLGPTAVALLCAAAIAALWVLPLIAGFVEDTVDDKVTSSSFDERSGADARSYGLLLETFGIGVGLGSHRPSSFLAAMLSTTGIIGTTLFAVVVITVIVRSAGLREYRPVVWALVSLLITKVIASPDLADSSGILWMSIGILAHGALVSTERDQKFALTVTKDRQGARTSTVTVRQVLRSRGHAPRDGTGSPRPFARHREAGRVRSPRSPHSPRLR